MPPRTSATDYQFHTTVGTATMAAEFTGHSIPTAEGPLTNEDYVAVEVAFFGPTGAKLVISSGDLSIRFNSKKSAQASIPYAGVFSTLKDPEYEPPEGSAPSGGKGGKTSLNSGGKQNSADGPPAPVKIPVPVMRAMAERVRKAALPEGDRALPQAGLVFFSYHGKTKNLQSIELMYEGPAGKATLELVQ